MKPIFALVIQALTLLTLYSCSTSSGNGRNVGVDASWYPLELDSRTNNVTAFSTELLTEIGRVEKIPFVKITVNWDNLLEGMQKGNYEAILSSMPPYIFNEKLYDFSEIYLALGPVLVVPVNSQIHSLGNLDGKEIGVISGSASPLILEKSNGVLIRYYESTPQALAAISAGTLDGAMIDVLTAEAFCSDLYQGKLKIATAPLNDEGLRLITKHGSASNLIKGFNKGLQRLKKNGSYEKLLVKWNLKEPLERS